MSLLRIAVATSSVLLRLAAIIFLRWVTMQSGLPLRDKLKTANLSLDSGETFPSHCIHLFGHLSLVVAVAGPGEQRIVPALRRQRP